MSVLTCALTCCPKAAIHLNLRIANSIMTSFINFLIFAVIMAKNCSQWTMTIISFKRENQNEANELC